MSTSWPPVGATMHAGSSGAGKASSAGGNGGTSTSTNASATTSSYTSNGSSSRLLFGGRAPLGRLPWKPTGSRRVLPSEYEAISLLINPPRVIFDNTVNPVSTVLKVDSANRHGCLLEVVQLLTDLGLIINKAFISSDGGWFMDEFHVTDQHGCKLQDPLLMAYIQQALGAVPSVTAHPGTTPTSTLFHMPPSYSASPSPLSSSASSAYASSRHSPAMLSPGLAAGPSHQPAVTASEVGRGGDSSSHPSVALASAAAAAGMVVAGSAAAAAGGLKPNASGSALATSVPSGTPTVAPCTTIELMAADRPGLLCDVSAVLAAQQCNVVDAEMWTHNRHVAAVVHITDAASGRRVDDPARVESITAEISKVVQQQQQQQQQQELLQRANPDYGRPTDGGKLASRIVSGLLSDQLENHSLPNAEQSRDRPDLMRSAGTAASGTGSGKQTSGSELRWSAGGGSSPPAGNSGTCGERLAAASGAQLASAVGEGEGSLAMEDRARALPPLVVETGSYRGSLSGVAAAPCLVWASQEDDLLVMTPGAAAAAAAAAAGTPGGMSRSSSASSHAGCDGLGLMASPSSTQVERRLHLLLAASQDYEAGCEGRKRDDQGADEGQGHPEESHGVAECGISPRGSPSAQELQERARRQQELQEQEHQQRWVMLDWGVPMPSRLSHESHTVLKEEEEEGDGDDDGVEGSVCAPMQVKSASVHGGSGMLVHRLGRQRVARGSPGSSPLRTCSSSAPSIAEEAMSAGLAGMGSGERVEKARVEVHVGDSSATGYTLISIRCPDRPKLLFDCVCTLTDMEYVVHHGTIDSANGMASQEYYIRRFDGQRLTDDEEKQHIAKCLGAAIHRRQPEGVCVEVSCPDRVGLLCDLTRAFHKHHLTVISANVSTRGEAVVDQFVVLPAVAEIKPEAAPEQQPSAAACERWVRGVVEKHIRKEIGGSATFTVRSVTPTPAPYGSPPPGCDPGSSSSSSSDSKGGKYAPDMLFSRRPSSAATLGAAAGGTHCSTRRGYGPRGAAAAAASGRAQWASPGGSRAAAAAACMTQWQGQHRGPRQQQQQHQQQPSLTALLRQQSQRLLVSLGWAGPGQ